MTQMTEVIVQHGDYLYDISRRHNINVKSLLSANPDLANLEVLPVGRRITIPRPSSRHASPPRSRSPTRPGSLASVSPPVSAPAMSLNGRSKHHSVRATSPQQQTRFTFPYGDKLPRIISIVTHPPLLKGAVSLLLGLLQFGQPHARTGACWQRVIGKPKVRDASLKERTAMMDGTVSISSLDSVPSRPRKPLFRAIQKGKKRTMGPARLKTVQVKWGDTLEEIAANHKLTLQELRRLNNWKSEIIFEGDILVVAEAPLRGELQDIRPGVRRTNRLLFSRKSEEPRDMSKLGIGGTDVRKVPVEGRWKRKRKGFRREHGIWRFSSPVAQGFVSSPFGWRWGAFHEGVDLAAESGTPILASERGMVTFAGWSGGYGNLVAIQHEGGFTTRYAHCCVIHSRVGQHVSRGEPVAAVGATGRATGPHLHFEVRRDGKALDPFHWVDL